jgi:membrane-bound serine protease (ClpP class)
MKSIMQTIDNRHQTSDLKKKKIGLICLVLLFFICSYKSVVFAQENKVYVLKFSGMINPMSANYITRGITKAEKENAEAVVIAIDTPGGLDKSMRTIVQKIMNTHIPVVFYVYPKGARAASAGVFIALASDIVAMSPGTNIGAAHPVDMAGKFASKKITNDAAAYIRSIAEKRKRNPVWAEKSVKESSSITETEALNMKITDVIADDINALLTSIDGKEVVIDKNKKTLNTKDAKVIYLDMSMREKLFNALGDPNIAYVLFMIGIYGLIYELASPGGFFGGIIGGICLILALVSFDSLSASLAGIFLIILAAILFIVDVYASTHGAFTIGGILSLLIGSLMLFSPQVPYFRLSMTLIIGVIVMTSLFFMFIVTKGILAQRKKVESGEEGLIGSIGEAKTDVLKDGIVYVKGEEWSAYAESAVGAESTVGAEGKKIFKGEKIKVLDVDGIRLKVIKIN